jgi:hypothetical protein
VLPVGREQSRSNRAPVEHGLQLVLLCKGGAKARQEIISVPGASVGSIFARRVHAVLPGAGFARYLSGRCVSPRGTVTATGPSTGGTVEVPLQPNKGAGLARKPEAGPVDGRFPIFSLHSITAEQRHGDRRPASRPGP